jgi:hypothetical protein
MKRQDACGLDAGINRRHATQPLMHKVVNAGNILKIYLFMRYAYKEMLCLYLRSCLDFIFFIKEFSIGIFLLATALRRNVKVL